MLKIRLQGTKNDIKWFQKIISRNPRIELLEFSNFHEIKEISKFYRAYVKIRKGKKVLVIDADAQSSLTESHGFHQTDRIEVMERQTFGKNELDMLQ